MNFLTVEVFPREARGSSVQREELDIEVPYDSELDEVVSARVTAVGDSYG